MQIYKWYTGNWKQKVDQESKVNVFICEYIYMDEKHFDLLRADQNYKLMFDGGNNQY